MKFPNWLWISLLISLVIAGAVFVYTQISRPDPKLRTWTAVADDQPGAGPDSLVPVYRYELRYFQRPITDLNWDSALIVPQSMKPKAPGLVESLLVSNMPTGRYYFAIKAQDSAGNLSVLSNIASAKVDLSAPARITDLK